MNPVKTDHIAELSKQIEAQLDRYPAISTQRREAYASFQKLGLPDSKNEEYKHTPVNRILKKSFDFATPPTTDAAYSGNINDHRITDLDCYTVTFVNGQFNESLSTLPSQKGVELLSLEKAMEEKRDVAIQHLATYANSNLDGLVAWNTAAWQSGLYLSVSNNIVVDKPILIHHLTDSSNHQRVEISRNLIVVEKSADVTIIQKFDSIGATPHFTNIVTEGVVSENGGLTFYVLQADQSTAHQFNQINIHQSNSSRINAFTFTLDGKLIRNNLQLTLDGEGCESHMFGLYLLNKDTLADNHTVADHQKPNSFSNELYKGVMAENSRGVFNGKIYVRPNAQKTNAFQSNRNILLSDNAAVNTKPQLEIWADDVKCSHGCTSGQLDEEALFYLQTRGIGKSAAQAMLLEAFAGEVLEKISIPVLKDFLSKLVTDRLYKTR